MLDRSLRSFAVLLAALCSPLLSGQDAAPTVSPLWSDHAVIQRGVDTRVDGRAKPGETVVVSFGTVQRGTRADASGAWSVTLPPLAARDEPRELVVRGDRGERRVRDLLVGEVWICAGQSNMEWRLRGASRFEEFRAEATRPRIRAFEVPNVDRRDPSDELNARWVVCSPDTVPAFSAVGYHFARHLHDALDVPIGLVDLTWGGSTVEAWIGRETLAGCPSARPFLAAFDAYDEVLRAEPSTWAGADVEDSNWSTTALPVMFDALELGAFDGVVDFRKRVDVPAGWVGRALRLSLGPIDDRDETWFGDVRVGATDGWQKPRGYTIPAESVAAGTAVVAVRMADNSGPGGFHGDAADLFLAPVDGADGERIELAGDGWRYRVVSESSRIARQHRPGWLFNGMVWPVRQLRSAGVIWYQGESNALEDRGPEYYELFPAMIDEWRRTFRSPELPVYFVQLPNFADDRPDTVWHYPIVRDAQRHTLRTVPHTGMAITLDLGEVDDIHPRNKHDVGERLARWALSDTYGRDLDVPKCGPVVRDVLFSDYVYARVTFDLFGSELAVRGGAETIGGFEVAGEDRAWQPATAALRDGGVWVENLAVPHVHHVRYAWRNDPSEATLMNAAGLPASPFTMSRVKRGER